MATRKGLIDFVHSKICTPYVYGAKGKVLTKAQIQKWAQLYPNIYTDAYIAKAMKYIGQECTDCSGLISWYTGILRGSYEYYETAVEKKPVAKLDETMTGWALWKPGHIGIYVGDGWCVEAKGIDYGTISSRVSNTAWKYVLKLADINYDVAEWIFQDGKWWYRHADGSCTRNGWEQIAGKWYYFDGDGWMQTGWIKSGGHWYYLRPDGSMVTGLYMVEQEVYYFEPSNDPVGHMVEGRFLCETNSRGALKVVER